MEQFGTELGFCAHTANVWQFIGGILLILKVLLPVIMIILGIVTLGKAILSDDDKEVKKGLKNMLTKFIIAIVIFFIPQLVCALFGFVKTFNSVKADYNVCKECIVDPNGDYCTTLVNTYTEG